MSSSGSFISAASRSAHRFDDPNKKRTADVLRSENEKRQFSDLHFPEKILTGLAGAGFLRPSPVQWSALPLAKIGVDLIVQSKSGTGKTLVYVVTALNMIDTSVNAVQAVILTPTREIAVQGARASLDIAAVSMPDLKVSTLIGGMSVSDDTVKLKRCHMVVGTPGRVRQLMEEKYLKSEAVRFFALDEADKMIESSFKNDVTWIYNSLPQVKQVIALSATYPESLANTLTSFMRSPKHVRLDADSQVLLGLDQYVLRTRYHPKPQYQLDVKFGALLGVLNSVTFSQCLIFTNYSLSAQNICERLNGNGWPAIYIAATLQNQYERLKALNSLRAFTTRIMVTTDLSARGVDAANVTLVINFDVPWDSRTYLHRSGRAGRFGSRGINLTLASEGDEYDTLRRIVFRTGTKIKMIPSNISNQIDDKGSKNDEDLGELPDFWKLDMVQVKEAVDNYTLLEGLECALDECEEEKQKTEKVKEDNGVEKGGKAKRRGRRKKKEAKNHPEDQSTGTKKNSEKMEHLKGHSPEFNDVDRDYESGYYPYEEGDEYWNEGGSYYYDDHNDDEYYDGEGEYNEEYYNGQEYYGDEEDIDSYEQQETREREELGRGHSKQESNTIATEAFVDNLSSEYGGDTDQYIIEQYAIATGYRPIKNKLKNISECEKHRKCFEEYEKARLLLSKFFKHSLSKKKDSRFEKLLSHKEVEDIAEQIIEGQLDLDSHSISDNGSVLIKTEPEVSLNDESLLEAVYTIQKYEHEKWESNVDVIAQKIKECHLSKSKIIERVLNGETISEILENENKKKLEISEPRLNELDNLEIDREIRYQDAVNMPNQKLEISIKCDPSPASLSDMFSTPLKFNSVAKKEKEKGQSEEKPTKYIVKQHNDHGQLGPDGLPMWVPIESDNCSKSNLGPRDMSTFQRKEVYRQGKIELVITHKSLHRR